MLTINGSKGEGGGQVLRTALAMSLVTGTPFRIEKIRAGRAKPGLMRQHLTAVQAAKDVGAAHVQGDQIGSQELTFTPSSIDAGNYTFSVGTAGSATLVLQTILPALLIADGPSMLILEGGTHNPFAPPYDFLAKSFVPLVNRMGPTVSTELKRAGFYPAGGGRFQVNITPAQKLTGFDLIERGEIRKRSGKILLSNLPLMIGEREQRTVCHKLGWEQKWVKIETVTPSFGPGNVVLLEIESEQVTETFTGFGEKSVKAETVASNAVREVRAYLEAEAPVGKRLADQLMVPLAIAGSGSFKTVAPTQHSLTNIEVLRSFLDVRLSLEPSDEGLYIFSVG